MEDDRSRSARVMVLYHSQSGHTKQMAELVAAGAANVPLSEVRLRSVPEATAEDLEWCDGIAVGSPTHMCIVRKRCSAGKKRQLWHWCRNSPGKRR